MIVKCLEQTIIRRRVKIWSYILLYKGAPSREAHASAGDRESLYPQMFFRKSFEETIDRSHEILVTHRLVD